MTLGRWDLLPCGADPELLVDIAAEGGPVRPDSHEADCSYCQAVLAEFDQMWAPVRRWAHQNVQVPRAFLATVLQRVRRMAQSPRLIASAGVKGITTVTSWALGLVASAASLATPGVAAVGGPGAAGHYRRHRGGARHGADSIDITQTGIGAVAVKLSLTALPQPDLPAVADRVRHNVMAAIRDNAQIQVTAVDITISGIDSL